MICEVEASLVYIHSETCRSILWEENGAGIQSLAGRPGTHPLAWVVISGPLLTRCPNI